MSHLVDYALRQPPMRSLSTHSRPRYHKGGACVNGKDESTGEDCVAPDAPLQTDVPASGAPQAIPPPIVAAAPAPPAPPAAIPFPPEKRPDCTYGKRLPTWQIVAVFMYLLIMLIGVALVIAYWDKWWSEQRIYVLLAILGIVVFLVLAIVSAVLAPCAPPPGDKW